MNEQINRRILGLDISTACIGITIIDDNGVDEPQIFEITHITPKIPSKKKGIEALILRKDIFEKDFLARIKELGITDCIIESPLTHASGNSSAMTVAQLLQFNGLLSEAIYRVLNIVPEYISSYDARMYSFPELISIRKFNKKGEMYDLKHYKKAIKKEHLVLFGSYPFDCEKKHIMMNMVREKYPDIKWTYDKDGELKKQNYDACDSLVCSLAFINKKRYGEIEPKIVDCDILEDNCMVHVCYTMSVWGVTYNKRITLKKDTD